MAKSTDIIYGVGTGTPVVWKESNTDLEIYVLQQKAIRNNLLAKSDKFIVSDYPTSKLEGWKTYRQLLRDFDFSSYEIRDEITWPTKPE